MATAKPIVTKSSLDTLRPRKLKYVSSLLPPPPPPLLLLPPPGCDPDPLRDEPSCLPDAPLGLPSPAARRECGGVCVRRCVSLLPLPGQARDGYCMLTTHNCNVRQAGSSENTHLRRLPHPGLALNLSASCGTAATTYSQELSRCQKARAECPACARQQWGAALGCNARALCRTQCEPQLQARTHRRELRARDGRIHAATGLANGAARSVALWSSVGCCIAACIALRAAMRNAATTRIAHTQSSAARCAAASWLVPNPGSNLLRLAICAGAAIAAGAQRSTCVRCTAATTLVRRAYRHKQRQRGIRGRRASSATSLLALCLVPCWASHQLRTPPSWTLRSAS